MTDKRRPAILFTAFEPSGDDLAAAVISAIRRSHPGAAMYAWGGDHMRDAGAEIVERTGHDAVMGFPGPAKILEHVRINKRIDAWMAENPVSLHVAVDSPAANFPICKIARKHGVRVVHLAAPQVWAWASWRVNKIRRLSDHVLCLLPFEEAWFRERSVKATFVGHPIFDETGNTPADWRARAAALGLAAPRVLLAPGSRAKELRRHVPLFLDVYRAIEAAHPGTKGRVALKTPEAIETVRSLAAAGGGLPDSIDFTGAGVDAAASWATIAVTKSGTVTLRIARQRTPMVVVYKASTLGYRTIGRFFITTPHFAMPNLVAGERIVPEFIPYAGPAQPVTDAALRLLEKDAWLAQAEALDAVARRFEGHTAAADAARIIAQEAGL